MADLVDKGLPDLFNKLTFIGAYIFDVLLKEDNFIRQRIGYLKEPSFSVIGHPAEKAKQKILFYVKSFCILFTRIIFNDDGDIYKIFPEFFRQGFQRLFSKFFKTLPAHSIAHDLFYRKD